MARGFGATLGAGATDAIATSLTAHSTLRSFSAQVYRNGDGGGSLGRIFEKRSAGAQVELLFLNSATYSYARQWGTQGLWSITAPATGAWHQVGVVYDAGDLANDPVMYLDGVSQTVSEGEAPSGSLATNADPYVIGNRTNDSARNWDGMIAEFAIWDALLTADEMRALGAGVSPTLIRPASLALYTPLVRDSIDLFGSGSLTVTGTAVQPHTRVQYARRSRFIDAAAAAAGGGASAFRLSLLGVGL